VPELQVVPVVQGLLVVLQVELVELVLEQVQQFAHFYFLQNS
jgi:hypothetical protein